MIITAKEAKHISDKAKKEYIEEEFKWIMEWIERVSQKGGNYIKFPKGCLKIEQEYLLVGLGYHLFFYNGYVTIRW